MVTLRPEEALTEAEVRSAPSRAATGGAWKAFLHRQGPDRHGWACAPPPVAACCATTCRAGRRRRSSVCRPEGAILLGKSNCSEFGIGNLHTGNRSVRRHAQSVGARPHAWRFEWRRERGGRRRPTSFGIGTDYGGSVRWPAHCTGVASLRPTPCRVPNTRRPAAQRHRRLGAR